MSHRPTDRAQQCAAGLLIYSVGCFLMGVHSSMPWVTQVSGLLLIGVLAARKIKGRSIVLLIFLKSEGLW